MYIFLVFASLTDVLIDFNLLFFFVIGDLNVGGIVAGVIVALLAVALLLFGLWYASKKGYLPGKF